jgi:predicted nuclease with TOPRIM domain
MKRNLALAIFAFFCTQLSFAQSESLDLVFPYYKTTPEVFKSIDKLSNAAQIKVKKEIFKLEDENKVIISAKQYALIQNEINKLKELESKLDENYTKQKDKVAFLKDKYISIDQIIQKSDD